METLKFQAFVVKQQLDNLGPNMHLAGVSEYESMIDVESIHFSNGQIDYVTDSDGNEYSYADKTLIAIRQYLNIHDIDDKPIYSGDIAECEIGDKNERYVGVCEFNKRTGGFEFGKKRTSSYGRKNMTLGRMKRKRVIGNIYQHSYLLKEAEEN